MDAHGRAELPRLTPEEAAARLRDGALVLTATETVYGLAATVDAVPVLASRLGLAEPPALAWHIGGRQRLVEVLGEAGRVLSGAQSRLIERFTPGPVMLAIECDAAQLGAVRRVLGVEAGRIDDGGRLLVRITSHPSAQGVLRLVDRPVVIAGVPGDRGSKRLDEVVRALTPSAGAETIAGAVDGEPRPLGMGSTLVELDRSGRVEVRREGALTGRYIRARLGRTVLFVCSGNTCRSPMAEAIARHEVSQREGLADVSVESAGAYTSAGMPATPEAVRAMERLGVPMHDHRSRPLTRAMIEEAHVIYALTAGHREAILAIDRSAADRVLLLDPEGGDVPDPIGHPQAVYDRTAARLYELIGQRLDELEPAAAG